MTRGERLLGMTESARARRLLDYWPGDSRPYFEAGDFADLSVRCAARKAAISILPLEDAVEHLAHAVRHRPGVTSVGLVIHRNVLGARMNPGPRGEALGKKASEWTFFTQSDALYAWIECRLAHARSSGE